LASRKGDDVNISVLLFAGLRERFRRSKMDIEVPPGATVAEVFGFIAHDPEEAKQLLRCTLCAVNQNHVSKDVVLSEGDELALIPPVAGG